MSVDTSRCRCRWRRELSSCAGRPALSQAGGHVRAEGSTEQLHGPANSFPVAFRHAVPSLTVVLLPAGYPPSRGGARPSDELG